MSSRCSNGDRLKHSLSVFETRFVRFNRRNEFRPPVRPTAFRTERIFALPFCDWTAHRRFVDEALALVAVVLPPRRGGGGVLPVRVAGGGHAPPRAAAAVGALTGALPAEGVRARPLHRVEVLRGGGRVARRPLHHARPCNNLPRRGANLRAQGGEFTGAGGGCIYEGRGVNLREQGAVWSSEDTQRASTLTIDRESR
eukprot:1195476-Prorocentrum_minimum.AAC.6